MSNFLKPLTDKVAGFLHPAAASTTASAPDLSALAVTSSAQSAPASSTTSTNWGLWALVSAVLVGAWYFITKRGDKRHKHKF